MDACNALRAWVLGGDRRYAAAAECLRRSGLPVRTYRVPGMGDEAEDLEKALKGAELLILPMRAFFAERLCIGTEAVEAARLPELLAPEAILVGGWFPEPVEDWLRANRIRCRSVLEVERYQIRNAAATAEAATGLLMEAMDRTVLGARILVIGWGRIGKQLAGRLHSLGAEVTVAVRRESHRAEIETMGMRSDITGRYENGLSYDAVVNTVPAPVISAEQGKRLGKNCVKLELASEPGGFAAQLPVLMGRGLPGTCVPVTAGEHLAEAVWDCLTGEGRTLE